MFVAGLLPRPTAALAYRPPAQSAPYIIHATPGEATRYPRGSIDAAVAAQVQELPWLWYFRPDVDVVIIWPRERMQISNTISVIGGRHVRTIGGHFRSAAGNGGAMLAFVSQFGSAFCEGALIDCLGHMRDGIVTRLAPEVSAAARTSLSRFPTIILQKCLVVGVDGDATGVHGDCYQSQAVVDEIRLEECTLQGAYQGIFPLTSESGPRRGLHIRRVNTRVIPGGSQSGKRAFHSYYFHHGSRERRETKLYPIRLSDVWAGEPTAAYWPWQHIAAVPNLVHSWGPSLRRDSRGEFLDYSRTGLDIRGIVRRGLPSGGDFAKARDVGVNYRSPWGTP